MKHRSVYSIVKQTDRMVWIVDVDGPVSVTNDAENVCEELVLLFGNKKIIYKDSVGNWDELVHDNGKFLHFGPARNLGVEV